MTARAAFLCLVVAVAPAPAFAQSQVTLSSAVFVETATADKAGRTRIRLHEPKVVTPGDKLVFVLNYRNDGTAKARGFVVTNPLPAAVAYEHGGTGNPELSVDGGRTWGRLADLRVRLGAGWRAATAGNVTHLRWKPAAILPPGATGSLSFRGIVR